MLCWTRYLEQNRSCNISERFVAELASLCRIQTPVTCVVVLAGEALVEVKTLLLLGAALEEVELAKLHDFRGVGVVRKGAGVSVLRTLALHEERANFGGFLGRAGVSLTAVGIVNGPLSTLLFIALPFSL